MKRDGSRSLHTQNVSYQLVLCSSWSILAERPLTLHTVAVMGRPRIGSKPRVGSTRTTTQSSRVGKRARQDIPRNTVMAPPIPSSQISAICKLRRERDELSYLDFVNETIKHMFSMHIQTIYDKMAEEYMALWVAKQENHLRTEPISDGTARPVTPPFKGEVMKIESEASPKPSSRVKLEVE